MCRCLFEIVLRLRVWDALKINGKNYMLLRNQSIKWGRVPGLKHRGRSSYGSYANVKIKLPFANAVINPLTVVVKSMNTFITNVAMPWVLSTYCFTWRAKHIRIKLFNYSFKWDLNWFLHIARLRATCHDKEKIRNYEEAWYSHQPLWIYNNYMCVFINSYKGIRKATMPHRLKLLKACK